MKLNVIVPARNEGPNIPFFYGRAKTALESIPGLGFGFEVLEQAGQLDQQGDEFLGELLGLYCGLRGGSGSGRALGCKEVEFAGQIRPHDSVVRYDVKIRRYTALKTGGTSVAIGTGHVLVDGELIYTIKDAKVGLFHGIAYPDYPRRSENARGGIMER